MSLQLRYLATLSEIATEKNSTILFPIPINFLEAFGGRPAAGKSEEAPPHPTKEDS